MWNTHEGRVKHRRPSVKRGRERFSRNRCRPRFTLWTSLSTPTKLIHAALGPARDLPAAPGEELPELIINPHRPTVTNHLWRTIVCTSPKTTPPRNELFQ
jgi:hypothetical protein